MEVSESQIEEILAGAPVFLTHLLELEDEPRLLVKQMSIPSGRLDLLYLYKTILLLLELKVVDYQQKHISQISKYYSDLVELQRCGKLIEGEIKPYLLCAQATTKQIEYADSKGITCVTYNPSEVLLYFFNNLKPFAYFSQVKPIDIGIWNIHLIHDLLYQIVDIHSIRELQELSSSSSKTLYNKIKFANELKLINWSPHSDFVSLTDFGSDYVKCRDKIFPRRISSKQSELLKDYISERPFDSSITVGIASIVEAVLTLAKNTYPVTLAHLTQYFVYHAGKYFDWKTKKAKYNATRMYTNYALDLSLLAKSGDSIYLTPEGLRFTIKMQLHKSLKMIDIFK